MGSALRVWVALSLGLSAAAFADDGLVRGVNLTEWGTHLYDASPVIKGIIDDLYASGTRHIVLAPRAHMTHPRSFAVQPVIPAGQAPDERERYKRLIEYIHGKGMTVGLRPIFFVVDQAQRTPYVEILPDGSTFSWWHGNILPLQIDKWFESFTAYLERYALIAKANNVEEFTLGAELYSMTVGIEDFASKIPSLYDTDPAVQAAVDKLKYGMGEKWLSLSNKLRAILPSTCLLEYDINFTDDLAGTATSRDQFGGEFARWRYRLVDLSKSVDPLQRLYWQKLADFWKSLDAVGIDSYRSLASYDQKIPQSRDDLVALLRQTSDRYAAQIDNALFEIENTVHQHKMVILKEMGFKSIDLSFIEPFRYAEGTLAHLNMEHQGAAYQAIFESFWMPKWDWFKGITVWDVSIDPTRQGMLDPGFSFLGKPPAQAIIEKYFGH